MALALVIRAGMFGFAGELDAKQITAFLTFISAGLATAATVFGALLTHEHNKRARRRQDFEIVIKSLEALPIGTEQRIGGVLAATVLLGQPRIAIRVLEPAWRSGQVDSETATWIIDEILLDAELYSHLADRDHVDKETVDEATVILEKHANDLTDSDTPGAFSFPGRYMHGWEHSEKLSIDAKLLILQATGEVLLSQGKAWWFPGDQLSVFPAIVWRDCIEDETEDILVRSSAAVLLDGLCECFTEEECERVACRRLAKLVELKKVDPDRVGPEFNYLSGQISHKFKQGT